jgi:hypothetical protein
MEAHNQYLLIFLQEAADTVTVDKVLDLRRGLPGATGPATTVYSVQQRGDPNFGVDPTRSAGTSSQCCGSGMIFFGSDPGSGSDFSKSFGSDPGSGS